MAKKTAWCEIPKDVSSQLGEGKKTAVLKLQGRRLCLVSHRESIYAIDPKCPHAGGPFAGGFVNDNNEIVCPWHRLAFDLETGQCAKGGYFINSYEIKEEDGTFWVNLPVRRFGFW